MDRSYVMSHSASSAISLPFQFDVSGSISSSSDVAKIWQDRVVATVMTGMGERVMRPTFGSEVTKTVGENVNDALALIRQSIGVAFSRWLTALTLVNVTGEIDPTDGYLVVLITYNYRAQNLTQTIKVKTAILSRSGDVILEVATNG
jgi:phage baseplate assembly protein W